MTFAIWGCGIRGHRLSGFMDSKYISAFIDSNEELWGTTIDDIPVMSYEDYKKRI